MVEVFNGKTGKYRCVWTLHGEFAGEHDAPLYVIDAKSYRPMSYKVMCPVCGEVWAEREVTKVEGDADIMPKLTNGYYPHYWTFRLRPCPTHHAPGDHHLKGSLWERWDRSWNKSLSLKLLAREVGIASDRFRKDSSGFSP